MGKNLTRWSTFHRPPVGPQISEEAAVRSREIGVIGQPLCIGLRQESGELSVSQTIARQGNGRLQPEPWHALREFLGAKEGTARRPGRNGGERAARKWAEPVLAN